MSDQLVLALDGPEEPAPPPPPPDAPVRSRIAGDTGATLFVEAGAGAGKTTALVERVASLVDDGIPIAAIAAITFTEKAAADLRHRLRQRLASGTTPPAPLRQAALEGLDHAPIGTLHAFARRLLLEFPVEAGVPPGFDVLDELESQLALDERWEDLQDELLDDAAREVAPGLRADELVVLLRWGGFGDLAALRGIVEDFHANWDLAAERVDGDFPDRPDVTTPIGAALSAGEAVADSDVPEGDGQQPVVGRVGDLVAELHRVGAGLPAIPVLEALKAVTSKTSRKGNKTNWRAHGGAGALDALRAAERDVAALADAALAPWRHYRRLVVGALARRFVLDGAAARAAAGTLEFHDLLVLARRLLTTSPSARRVLHERYRRLLLDEFQDTDPIQLEIAVRLAAPPDDQPMDISGVQPRPGRLFVVGDPKQSIYRFRRADIAVYLGAARRIGAEEVALSANFRSTGAVIDWVNGVFADVIKAEPDVQPAYRRLDVARPGSTTHGTVTVLGAAVHEETPDEPVPADELRAREAGDVAAIVATALQEGWLVGDVEAPGGLRPCRAGDIAILLPARTSLPLLERSLAELTVPYQAENSSVVYLAPEIRHVMLALAAAADPTDQLALLGALRSPLYGCSDVDLYDWKVADGRWSIFADPPTGQEANAVAEGLAHVRSLAERAGRAGPAELVDAVVGERRVLETALGAPGSRDVWRRVRYVVDQARAWTDAGGHGLRRYLRWTRFQASEGRASDTVLPERDHDAVRIMTVHAAKGLEFPITVLAGLTTRNQGRRSMSVVWPDRTWTLVERDNPVFESFQPLDEQMSDAERRRLLYVACTRAVDHLVVSLHRKPETETRERGRTQWTSASVLAASGALEHGAGVFAGTGSAVSSSTAEAPELPWADPVAWATERARAIADATRRTTTSATRVAAAMPVSSDAESPPADQPWDDDGDLLGLTVDAGLAKDPVDLDLPPWQRGRYGTAIGRAVHAVLQDADLGTGDDIERLAASAAAAEGIFGLEPAVAVLSRSALSAPVVRLAAAGAEHWRELYVVADLGGVVLEGYIDLLVRTPAGLVVVDYKTDALDDTRPALRAERLARYRHQLAAYGAALARILDEPVVGGVLVQCRSRGPAEQIDVPAWVEAVATVEAAGPAFCT